MRIHPRNVKECRYIRFLNVAQISCDHPCDPLGLCLCYLRHCNQTLHEDDLAQGDITSIVHLTMVKVTFNSSFGQKDLKKACTEEALIPEEKVSLSQTFVLICFF